MFKELFRSMNVDSIKKAIPKVSICNGTIAMFVEEIYSKYGMALTFTHLESCEVSNWAETFQVAKGNSKGPMLSQPQQLSKKPPKAEQLQPIKHNHLQSQHNSHKMSNHILNRKIRSLHHHRSKHNRQRYTG